MSDLEDLPRETGAERSGQSCPTCGTELPAITTAYGSVTPGACGHCAAGQVDSSQLEQQVAASQCDVEIEDDDPDEVED